MKRVLTTITVLAAVLLLGSRAADASIIISTVDRYVQAKSDLDQDKTANDTVGDFDADAIVNPASGVARAHQSSDITALGAGSWRLYASAYFYVGKEEGGNLSADSFFDVFFNVDAPTSFEAVGWFFNVVDPVFEAGTMVAAFSLTKVGDPIPVLSAQYVSGDSSGSEHFRLNGTLQPGDYEVLATTHIDQGLLGMQMYQTGRTGCRLTLTPVPEPSTLIVWTLLGALGITAGRLRRRVTISLPRG